LAVWKQIHSRDEGEELSEIAHSGIYLYVDRPATDFLPEKQFMPKWFAVYTSPRHEKRVAQHMAAREIEHYLPLYHPQRKWSDGSTVTLDLPLFPGYLFVRTRRSERVRVLEVPGVLTFVGGTGGQPAPLPDAEIDALRVGLPLRQVEPHPLLTVGQRARIRSGALAGMEGVVVRQKNGLRVVLTVDLIMQSIAVEVDGTELEPLDSAVPGCVSDSASWPGLRSAQLFRSGSERLALP
jgi:transcription antitermination factor NusG